MVKVIGRDVSAAKQVTCRKCASILEYTLSEVKEYHGRDYSGGSDGQEWIDCPKCKSKVNLRSW